MKRFPQLYDREWLDGEYTEKQRPSSAIAEELGCSVWTVYDWLARHEIKARGNLTHGMVDSPTYRSWKAMLDRCRQPATRGFQYYGGRGISVCERWRRFEHFLADMGERPEDQSIDRIDSNGNYEPNNCRWATVREQRANRRDCV